MPSSLPPSPTSFTVFRTGDKPLRFAGWKVADIRTTDHGYEHVTRVRLFRSESNSYIWSWDRFATDDYEDESEYHGVEPDASMLERADAVVVPAKDPAGNLRDLDEVVRLTWDHRPTGNGRLTEAATRAWHKAAEHDPAIAKNLYEEVE